MGRDGRARDLRARPRQRRHRSFSGRARYSTGASVAARERRLEETAAASGSGERRARAASKRRGPKPNKTEVSTKANSNKRSPGRQVLDPLLLPARRASSAGAGDFSSARRAQFPPLHPPVCSHFTLTITAPNSSGGGARVCSGAFVRRALAFRFRAAGRPALGSR